jgi:N-acetylmuramoyl-L-alanine amidase
VRLLPPAPVLADAGPLVVDSSSVTPRGQQAWRAGDPVRVSVRAPRNASVALRGAGAAGAEVALTNRAAALSGAPNADARRTDPYLFAADVPARDLAGPAARPTLVVRRGADSVTLPVARVLLADSAGPRYAVAGAAPSQLPDTDRVITVRPVPNGTYKWFLLPGTVVQTTARAGAFARVRLDDSLEGWVDPAELSPLPDGFAPARRVAGNARVVPGGDGEWSDVVVPMAERPPYAVETSEDGGALVLTLYGVVANTDIVNYAAGDSLVRRVVWEQLTADRARYTIVLRRPAFGYLARYERGAFVLRVRRPPVVDPERPLAGVTVAVDAGHPPAGSTGPTGLYEAVATLAIASRVQTYLEQRGARVVMTRTAPGAVPLTERPVIARRANAHAFVSIHLNALPDGVNPATAHGTGTYYFNATSEPLAREIQRGMVRRMGLRDLGINYDNLAVLRPTWMPAVLCEGAFVMIPEQEAALRTPEFQDRYALGVAEGIEAYFRALGGARPVPSP